MVAAGPIARREISPGSGQLPGGCRERGVDQPGEGLGAAGGDCGGLSRLERLGGERVQGAH